MRTPGTQDPVADEVITITARRYGPVWHVAAACDDGAVGVAEAGGPAAALEAIGQHLERREHDRRRGDRAIADAGQLLGKLREVLAPGQPFPTATAAILAGHGIGHDRVREGLEVAELAGAVSRHAGVDVAGYDVVWTIESIESLAVVDEHGPTTDADHAERILDARAAELERPELEA